MIQTAEGVVTGLIAGFYDVEINGKIIRTRARGVFRQKKQKPVVGDHVEVQLDEQGTNYLTKILPRLNRIGRPALANVSHVILVISAVQPDFSVQLLDRFLTFFAWQKVQVTIYLSKTDLIDAKKLQEIKKILAYYQAIGYPVFDDDQTLAKVLTDKITSDQIWTLAGQSGAGKSTLLNKIKLDAKQATGEISNVLNRGKHTTRKVELFKYASGFVADTPGFSAIDLTPIKIDQLKDYFIEFSQNASSCKFRGCQHLKEPHCMIKDLLEEDKILKSRYQSYLLLRKEIGESRVPEYLK